MMASRWDVARRLVEQDLDEWRADHLRAWALRNRAVFYTYVGEFDAALETYRAAGLASGFRTHEGQSGGVPASALQLMAELLHAAGESSAAREEAERALAIEPESYRGLYYAGRMALADDDPEAASRYLESLDRLGATRTSPAARSYRDALEGEIALAAGEAERARERFEAAVDVPLLLDWASTCSSSGAAIREGLARAYLALGRRDDAARTLEVLLASGEERVDHPVLYAGALHRLGMLDLDGGRDGEGRRLLERFLALWGDASWDMPMVDEARERLARR
jgi:tetratricopeptide (TPR) repeat protein